MIMRILITFLLMIFCITCAEKDQYGGGKSNTNTTSGTGFSTGGHTGDSNTRSSNTSCPSANNWGGITCKSGGDRDQNFLNFLSNAFDPRDRNTLGDISCSPSNTGGILFRMKVTLNGKFDPNGSNDNLAMQPASSHFEIAIYDSWVQKDNEAPIGSTFEGLSGEVNGDQANLTFIYEGKDKKLRDNTNYHTGRKTVRLNGAFNADYFEGTISYENEKKWDGTASGKTPGLSGTLGQFKVHTCAVFLSP